MSNRVPRTPPPMPSPYTVLVDTAEQLPWAFSTPLVTDRRCVAIQTAPACLRLAADTELKGDYSLAGFESLRRGPGGGPAAPCVMVERKSLADLYSTLGQERARFVRKLDYYTAFTFAAVVVEAELSTVMTAPPRFSKLNPRSILGSVLAWQVRFPGVHWWFLPGREVAEAFTARLLDRFWREQQEILKVAQP